MRTLCDACEGAAAVVFCAADEAALCRSCDEKVCFPNTLITLAIPLFVSWVYNYKLKRVRYY